MTLAHPEWLVGTEWLEANLGDPDLRIFDVTAKLSIDDSVDNCRADFEAAHVPGAGYLDIARELSDTDSPLIFTRPSPDALASVLGAAGIGDRQRVVVYSATHAMWATRVFWLLRGIGFDRCAVLDGGLGRWRQEGRPLSDNPCVYPAVRLQAHPRPTVWADRDQVLAAIDDRTVCTICALPRVMYTGEAEKHYGRPGRIAGSENVPFTDIVDPVSGSFRTPADWRSAFEVVGAFTRSRVITYCGGAIAGTVDAFALAALGHPNVAVYDGSLDEWSRDPSLPMEIGEPDRVP
jgi:thiosulfate/3-mercaptopyruvate sulfurtransferase